MRPSPSDRERHERELSESRVPSVLSRLQETGPTTGAGHQHVAMAASPDASAGLTAAGDFGVSAVPRRTHLLTVALEDYYHNFERVIARSHWDRFENRVERSTMRALALLDEFGIRATFFTLGWVASTLPELVREVANRGHEIASKGYHQRNLREMSPSEFRDDLTRSREALEHASGQRVVGYRAPGWLKPSDVWALEVLAEEGYRYDSSVKPLLFRFHGEPSRRLAHEIVIGERRIWEFPISTLGPEGLAFPIGAGNYFRQLPESMVRRAVARWERRYSGPFTMYFHTWSSIPISPRSRRRRCSRESATIGTWTGSRTCSGTTSPGITSPGFETTSASAPRMSRRARCRICTRPISSLPNRHQSLSRNSFHLRKTA